MLDVAIVKASFTRKAGAAKATVRYNQNRRGKEGTKITRQMYGWDGKMERKEAYQMIDEAPKGSYFYRLILNPDPTKEDTHRDIYVWKVAEKTMRGLEGQLDTSVQWVAATHDDHSPLRHVHLLAILPRKLDRGDLQFLREMATGAALDQRRERDNILERREKGKEQAWERQRERSK